MIISNLELVSQGPKLTHTTFSIRTISHRTSSSHHRARRKLIRNISCKLLHTQGMSLFPPPDGYRLKKKKAQKIKEVSTICVHVAIWAEMPPNTNKSKNYIYQNQKNIYFIYHDSYTMPFIYLVYTRSCVNIITIDFECFHLFPQIPSSS